MQFITTAILFAAAVVAMPQPGKPSWGEDDKGSWGEGDKSIKYPVHKDWTIQQAQNTCGNGAKVSCCNKATYTHDIKTKNYGPLAGVLENALGGGPGGDGLGLFGQCNDLSLDGTFPD